MASQSRRDCSDAAGEVSSMYSTPNESRALAMAILVLVSKKALANCSPSADTPMSILVSIPEAEGGLEHTSECGFNDLEVGDIVQEVGSARSVGVSTLSLRHMVGGAVSAIASVLNANPFTGTAGRDVAVCVRAHCCFAGRRSGGEDLWSEEVFEAEKWRS